MDEKMITNIITEYFTLCNYKCELIFDSEQCEKRICFTMMCFFYFFDCKLNFFFKSRSDCQAYHRIRENFASSWCVGEEIVLAF